MSQHTGQYALKHLFDGWVGVKERPLRKHTCFLLSTPEEEFMLYPKAFTDDIHEADPTFFADGLLQAMKEHGLGLAQEGGLFHFEGNQYWKIIVKRVKQ